MIPRTCSVTLYDKYLYRSDAVQVYASICRSIYARTATWSTVHLLIAATEKHSVPLFLLLKNSGFAGNLHCTGGLHILQPCTCILHVYGPIRPRVPGMWDINLGKLFSPDKTLKYGVL